MINLDNIPSDEEEYLDRKQERANKIVLPQWLADELPEHEEVVTIRFSEELNNFVLSTGDMTFDSLQEACRYIDKETELQYRFDINVDGHGGSLMGDGMFFCNAEKGSHSAPLLIAHTTHESLELLRFSYLSWIEDIGPLYEKKSLDWAFCYRWLNDHPMGWTKRTAGKSFDWETNSGLRQLYTMVDRDREGNAHVNLEHGSHTPGDGYMNYYHDIRLDVHGSNFEEAYIFLAAKVDMFFNIDGTEKENVKYEKSLFELWLEQISSKLKQRDAKEE